MSTKDKARKILYKLYIMRKGDFAMITVEDILAKATAEEINYYYFWLYRELR